MKPIEGGQPRTGVLALLFSGYIVIWAMFNRGKIPIIAEHTTLLQKIHASRSLLPLVLLIALVLGWIYTGLATATEAAAFGVVEALAISGAQDSLNWQTFRDSLHGGARLPVVRIY